MDLSDRSSSKFQLPNVLFWVELSRKKPWLHHSTTKRHWTMGCHIRFFLPCNSLEILDLLAGCCSSFHSTFQSNCEFIIWRVERNVLHQNVLFPSMDGEKFIFYPRSKACHCLPRIAHAQPTAPTGCTAYARDCTAYTILLSGSFPSFPHRPLCLRARTRAGAICAEMHA